MLDIIPVEAESPPDPVFLATHSNLAIYRKSNLQSSGGEIVHEDELLAAVANQPADLPIIPILGNSGTGKSHLVRWLRMQLLEAEKSVTNRRVIFVPKHKMSLRAILDLILDQTTSSDAADFRQRVHNATEQLANEKDARNRLRATLSYLLAESPQNTVHLKGDEKDERDYLAASLPSLLDDPIFKPRLLADDGALARLSKEKFSGKSNEDKEDAFEFTAEDLRLSIDDTNRASAEAREVAETLAGDLGLRELAARMLNEQLSPAVSSVFGVGGDDLKNLLIDLRQDLAKSGEEILLLIEDFSIFQGVQGGLIDAMTQVPTLDNPICPMKVVMAVTTGYFNDQVPDTAKTRTFCAFDLDVSDSAQSTDLPSFVAPYLNAVRVGSTALEDAFIQREPIPNACDVCPAMDACHSAYGAHAGIGLYPFNEFALGRAVRSRQSDTGIFVARSVLKDVLRPVLLDDRDAIAESRFPTNQFETRFPVNSDEIDWNVEETAKIRTRGESDELVNRRRRMLTFYAEQPAPQNLSPYIHESLGIPAVPGLPSGAQKRPKRGEDPPTPPTPPPPPPPPKQESQLVQAVDAWAARQPLQQAPQNELRKLVFNAVVEQINFEDGLRGDTSWTVGSSERAVKGSQQFGHQQSIFFEGTKKTDSSGVRIDILYEDIDAVRAVRALAQLAGGKSWAEIDSGAELQRLATRQIRKWAEDVERQLGVPRDNLKSVDLEVGYLASALLVSAQMLGIEESFNASSPDSVMNAVFAATPDTGLDALPATLRTFRIFASEEKGKSSREALQRLLLRRSSYTQGGGADAGVDTSRILQSMDAYATAHAVPDTLPSGVIDYVKRLWVLHENTEPLRAAVLAAIPDSSAIGPDVEATVEAVDKALKALQIFEMVPSRVDVADVVQRGKFITTSDLEHLETLQRNLDRWDSLSNADRLQALRGDWPLSAGRVGPWIYSVVAALNEVEKIIDSKIDPDLANQTTELDVAVTNDLQEALATLDRLFGEEGLSSDS